MSIAAVDTRSQASSGLASRNIAEVGDRFLKLLVTQMQNQDPLNPLDNAEITSQLAQLSTVEGIDKLNTSMSALSTQFRASQALQGAGLIGRSVLAAGTQLELGEAGAAGAVDLAAKADLVRVDILDAGGKIVRSLELGAQEAGMARFTWDGKDSAGNALAAGVYDFAVTASAAGQTVAADAYALAKVLSVAVRDSGLDMELSGLGTLGLDKIRQIF